MPAHDVTDNDYYLRVELHLLSCPRNYPNMLLSPLILVAVLPTGSFAISTSGQDDPDSSPGPFDFDITRHTIEESEVHARRSGHSPLGPRGVNLE
jgi:hypothetical protein